MSAAVLVPAVLALTAWSLQPSPVHAKLTGSLTVENAPPYGHPGTPFSAVRINRENGALASVIRLSVRPTEPNNAQAGFGGCITFQGKLESGGPDRDLAHLCVYLDGHGNSNADLILRDGNGRYRVAQRWPVENPVTPK